jgi:excisionase family DNA binding protein
MPITLTLTKAAEESGLSLRTLQYAITRGELRSVTVGRRRLIPMDALRRFLLNREGQCSTENKQIRPRG